MTRDEFRPDIARLGKAWGLTIQAQTAEVVYGRIKYTELAVWRDAVDTLLVNFLRAPHSGFLDQVLKAVEQAREERARQAQARDRVQADRWLRGQVSPCGDTAEERSHAALCVVLIRTLMQGVGSARYRAAAELIADWIGDRAQAEWAKRTMIESCEWHSDPHSLLDHYRDVMQIYEREAAGDTPKDARAAVTAEERHDAMPAV